MANVTASKENNSEADFFPLTVNYQEKFYSVGKIPGGFFKREGRPGEKETLTSRLIDRPIRPLFHPKFKNETKVIFDRKEAILEGINNLDKDSVLLILGKGQLNQYKKIIPDRKSVV